MGWIGLMWLRTWTSGGLLGTRYWTFGFHKMLGSSWGAAQLAGSKAGLSSLSEWVTLNRKSKEVNNRINRVVCVMEKRCVFSELVNGFLNVTDTHFTLHRTAITSSSSRHRAHMRSDRPVGIVWLRLPGVAATRLTRTNETLPTHTYNLLYRHLHAFYI
jgi:hypothetical protein